MNAITNETMTALAADLTSAVKDMRSARLAIRASIKAIRDAGDWTATEHKSWTTFAAVTVKAALPKNTPATVWTVVAVALAEEGMSVRTIAPVVEKSPAGVSKAIRQAIAAGDATMPETSTGADGKARQTSRAKRAASQPAKKATAAKKGATGASTGKPDTSVSVDINEYIASVGALLKAVDSVKAARPKSRDLTPAQRAAQGKRLAEAEKGIAALRQGLATVKSDAERKAS